MWWAVFNTYRPTPPSRCLVRKFGEAGLKDDFHGGHQYQNYNYFHNDFGLYDDDPQIETVGGPDFFRKVVQSEDLWFVNFYSPGCGHCHELAPIWRQVGFALEDLVHVAAVNCQDEWNICQQMGIHAYPTLLIFTQPEHWVPFHGARTFERLTQAAVNQLPLLRPFSFGANVLTTPRPSNWVVIFCLPWVTDCPSKEELRQVQAIAGKNVVVGLLNCALERASCEDMNLQGPQARFYPRGTGAGHIFYPDASEEWTEVFNVKTLGRRALSMIPLPAQLSEREFSSSIVAHRLVGANAADPAWVIVFYDNGCLDCDQLANELRKIDPLQLPVKLASVQCDHMRGICQAEGVFKLPRVHIYKSQGYEIYYGGSSASQLQAWIRETSSSTVVSVVEREFNNVIHKQSDEHWFLDFYAPWCPPCRQMMPVFREASKHAPADVRFGTVDCTTERSLCHRFRVTQYPTALFFKRSTLEPVPFVGDIFQVDDFLRHIEDILDPAVVDLRPETFEPLVLQSDTLWVVDFYAPWCGPCQALAPEFSGAARRALGMVSYGKVDCEMHGDLCATNGIRSYPSVRLYSGRPGTRTYQVSGSPNF